jgi:hypothetical protein
MSEGTASTSWGKAHDEVRHSSRLPKLQTRRMVRVLRRTAREFWGAVGLAGLR